MKSFFKIGQVSTVFEEDESLFPKILQLDKQLAQQQWSLEGWDKLRLNKNQKYYLAILRTTEDLCSFCLFESLSSMGYAHILKVVTDIELRKQGFGRLLIEQCLAFMLESEKLERTILEVDVSNNVANAFYQSLGFRAIHQNKSFYKNGNDAYVMELLF